MAGGGEAGTDVRGGVLEDKLVGGIDPGGLGEQSAGTLRVVGETGCGGLLDELADTPVACDAGGKGVILPSGRKGSGLLKRCLGCRQVFAVECLGAGHVGVKRS